MSGQVAQDIVLPKKSDTKCQVNDLTYKFFNRVMQGFLRARTGLICVLMRERSMYAKAVWIFEA